MSRERRQELPHNSREGYHNTVMNHALSALHKHPLSIIKIATNEKPDKTFPILPVRRSWA